MSEWISIEDRLPDLPTKGRRRAYVIGYMPALFGVSLMNGTVFVYWNGHEFRYGDETRVRHNVTHWMPQPEPPK